VGAGRVRSSVRGVRQLRAVRVRDVL
jgi:hypothetical protein